MVWIPQSPKPESLNISLRGNHPGDISKSFCPCHNCYTISPCTVRLNCSTARQRLTSIHFLCSFFSSPSWSSYSTCLQWQSQFLEPPTDLTVASTPIISILTSRRRGAFLRTSRVFIDIICSNGLVKLIWERVLQDFERINGYLGSTKSQEAHYFSSTTWEMSLPRRKKIVIWKSTWMHSRCLCSHICSDFFD